MQRRILTGVIHGSKDGYGFLIAEEEKKDFFISHGDLKGAMHKDVCLCEIISDTEQESSARVLKIVERGIRRLTGTYFSNRHGGYVIPDDQRYFCNVNISFGKGLRAKSGDKVVCNIIEYPKKQNPKGLISKIFGRQFEKNAELKAIEFTYNLPEKFPKRVIEECALFSEESFNADLKRVKDFTSFYTMTIDGEDARDFDDAVSIKKDEEGNYILGVHIADVSRFVRENSETDKEAYQRGTSVYFPEKVIPMLPEKLCNDLCSLKEGVNRFTMSCVMKVDRLGKVIDYEIVNSVIRSRKRMTYTAVQRILDGDKEALAEFSEQAEHVLLMQELADILSKKRDKNGNIDLNVKDSVVSVDKDGKVEVFSEISDKAHKLIEEFMILANVTVAEYMFYAETPFIYRVHAKPEAEKVSAFYAFLDGIGIRYKKKKGEIFPTDFQAILKQCEGTPSFSLINRVMLRSMQKAKYSEINTGHFGLSEKTYCHFTSPIRRYPDLVVHRILKAFINGEDNLREKFSEFVIRAAKQSSEKERNAQDAERTVIDYYKMLYIDNFIGEEFDAVVSGVTNFGIFAELDNGIEGLIKIETLYGRFKLDKGNYLLTNGKLSYKLGQSIKIKVAGVNMVSKKAEFILAE